MGLVILIAGGGGLLGLALLIAGAIYKKRLLMVLGIAILAAIAGLFVFG